MSPEGTSTASPNPVSRAPMRVDMHLHTSRSFDCLSDPQRVLDAAARRNIDVICVTDHNEIETALELKARYPDRIIVGEEVKTAEGVDVIGLFIEQQIPKGTPARRTCELIHEQGGIVYMPHPYAGGKGGNGRLLEELGRTIDAVEAFNGRIHRPELNDRAAAWAQANDLPVGAGSDAHTLAEVGRAYVEIPWCALEPAAFLASLRQGSVFGRSASHLVHIASTYAKLHKKVFGKRR